MRVCKHGCDVLDSHVLLSYFIKAIEYFFHVYIAPYPNTRGVGRILERYANPRLCNCLEFSQPLLVFRRGYVNTEKVRFEKGFKKRGVHSRLKRTLSLHATALGSVTKLFSFLQYSCEFTFTALVVIHESVANITRTVITTFVVRTFEITTTLVCFGAFVDIFKRKQ